MKSLAHLWAAAALSGDLLGAPAHRYDYPQGYRAEKRLKSATASKRAKRKAQRRARRITRSKS